MKVSSGPVYDLFRKGEVVSSQPRLLAEWNFNRFVPTTVDNVVDETQFGYDPDLYPIEDIAKPLRPGRGIVKARLDEAKTTESYQDRPNAARYFLASADDKYKYWCSPAQSTAGGALTDTRPSVNYDRGVPANKIVVGLETTTAAPDAWTILVHHTGGVWQSVATNPGIDSQGRVTLWLTSTGWQSAPGDSRELATPTVDLDGIRVNVTSLDNNQKFFNLIELSLRHEKNLTQYLIDSGEVFDMSERSEVAPMGKASSNYADITLFNDHVDDTPSKGFLFNTENPQSPYFGLVDANVKFTLDHIIDASDFGGAEEEVVRGFQMYSGVWSGQRTDTLSLNLTDSSKFLQEIKPNPCLYNDLTTAEIVWRLLDSVGFDRYEITDRDDDPQTTVPHFWTDGESTVWEVFAELSESTQTAIFFDENDTLQVWTRRQAYNESKPVAWTLRADDSGAELADITNDGNLTVTEAFEANKITVSYQVTEFSAFRHGYPLMDVVWTPEDTLVLRASELQRDIDADNQDFIWLKPNDAKIWPYEGIVNIEGEIIRYKGKQFFYHDENNVKHSRVVESQGEQRKYNEKAPAALRYRNHLTGALNITKRGLWNSHRDAHHVEANGYNLHSYRNGVHHDNPSGFRYHKKDGLISLRSAKKYKRGDFLLATHGSTADSPWFYMGTAIKFPKGKFDHDCAGIVFNNSGTKEDGYYVEVRPSKYITGTERFRVQEISFYSRIDGVNHRIGGQTVKVKSDNGSGKPKDDDSSDKAKTTKTVHTGVGAAVQFDQWGELDIAFLPQSNNDHVVSISWNGQLAFNATITASSGLKNAGNGKFGVFTRGNSDAEFDYLYAISHGGEDKADDMSFFDQVSGGYIGRQPYKEWVWRVRDRHGRGDGDHKPKQDRYNVAFFDEFGPLVHEVREFDVKFDPMPVLHSRLIVSNDYEAVCPAYNGDAFGARFVLANISRKNAVLQGSDSLTFAGSDSNTPVDQQTVILGRALIQRDAKKVVVKNEDQIKARGLNELEFSSRWIQTKEDAQDLGDWIELHWGRPSDEVEVAVFGNPLFQIGDLVSVAYPRRDMTPAKYKYWVVGYNNSFSNGLQTTLTLRRCLNA